MKPLNWFAILGAFVVMMIGGFLATYIIHNVVAIIEGPARRIGRFIHPWPLELVSNLTAAFLLNLICGYLVAAWVPYRKMAHAHALTWLTFVVILFSLSSWRIVVYPDWYQWIGMASPLSYLVGARLHLATHSPETEPQYL
jgi:hypothetical protein